MVELRPCKEVLCLSMGRPSYKAILQLGWCYQSDMGCKSERIRQEMKTNSPVILWLSLSFCGEHNVIMALLLSITIMLVTDQDFSVKLNANIARFRVAWNCRNIFSHKALLRLPMRLWNDRSTSNGPNLSIVLKHLFKASFNTLPFI